MKLGRIFLITVAALVLVLFTSGGNCEASILRHPETQITVAGGSVIYVCTGEGEVIWYIDDQSTSSYSYKTDLESDGFTFDTDSSDGIHNLTMGVPAENSRNGTKIQCKAFTFTSDAASNVAWLWIVGPPLHPDVRLELVSWNTMQLSWAAPFTTEGYPIERYIVYTTNTSTDQRTRTDIYPTTGTETHTILDTPSDCHTLQFEVLAKNSAGLSTAGEASGGFPVAVSEIDVNVSVVLLLEDLRPLIIISFHLPDICSNSGVSATYIVELKTAAGDVVHRTTANYQHSILIEETQELDSCTSYTVNVTVFVSSHAELGSFSTVREIYISFFCPTDSPSSTPPSSDTSTPVSDTIPPHYDVTQTRTPVAPSHSSSSEVTQASVPAVDGEINISFFCPTDSPSSTPPSSDMSTPVSDTIPPHYDVTQTRTPVAPSHSSSSEVTQTSVPAVDGVAKKKSSTDDVSVTALVMVCTILLVIVLAGVGCAVAVLVLRQRRKTADRQLSSRPLPAMAANPIYDSGTPVYDVIPETRSAKPLTLLPQPTSSTDTRYALTPVSDVYLGREDLGIQCDTVSKKCSDETGNVENEVEKEDCYVLMKPNIV